MTDQKLKAWNKGKKGLRKPPFSPESVQIIKLRLAQERNLREGALFALGIDSVLRESDLLALKVSDIADKDGVKKQVSITAKKTGKEHIFEITPETQKLLKTYILESGSNDWGYLFPSPRNPLKPFSTRQLRNLVKKWCILAGLNPSEYGTHSLRRTLPSYIYAQTGNLRACQILLDHKNISTTAIYLGVEQKEALEIARKYRL